MTWWLIVLFGSSFVLAAGFTRVLIAKAEYFGLLDIPNERSSHAIPRPRGGGLGFVFSFLIGSLALWYFGEIPKQLVLPLVTAAPIVAFVGFLDDRKGVSPLWRLFVHFFVAAMTCFFVTDGFHKSIDISFMGALPGWIEIVYSLFFIAWMINLYNFMDGVDGMAATQAIVVSLCSAGLCLWQQNTSLALLYALIACSVSGFLLFNWAPAKIFMGDGGAYFLGFLFAALALMNKMFFDQSLIALMILMGTFIVDATYTLCRRLLRGEKVYLPHKKHAFQRAVERGLSHAQVTGIYNLITALWLAPLAIAAVVYANLSILFLLIAYVPLLTWVIYLRAGSEAPPKAGL